MWQIPFYNGDIVRDVGNPDAQGLRRVEAVHGFSAVELIAAMILDDEGHRSIGKGL